MGVCEFDNTTFGAHFLKHDIYFEMLATFWVDAIYTAVFIVNCLPTPIFYGLTPFQKLF